MFNSRIGFSHCIRISFDYLFRQFCAMSSESSVIKTFVFFDIETTGLPEYEFNKTRITELSMIAAERDHLLNTKANDLPRVLQKLSLCVYPQKRMQPMSIEITGLSNELLENQKPFDLNTFNMIHLFLSQLPRPICLVAHNGNVFDYPILQKEICRLKQSFPEEFLCADSLIAFRELYQQNLISDNFEEPNLGIVPLELKNDETDIHAPYSSITLIPDSTETMPGCIPDNTKTIPGCISDNNEAIPGFNPDKVRTENETTPKRSTSASYIHQKQIRKEDRLKGVNSLNPIKSRRSLFTNKPKISFKLVDIYERMFQKKAESSHRAEGDVLLLMHTAIACKDNFFDWCDKNAKPFHLVKEL